MKKKGQNKISGGKSEQDKTFDRLVIFFEPMDALVLFHENCCCFWGIALWFVSAH